MPIKVKVYSPGSIGNVGCGFDVFGMAVEAAGDIVEISQNDHSELRITAIEGDSSITTDPLKNIVTVGARALLDHLRVEQGFDFKITKGVAAGSGMGSSGCSATAGVFAVNEILQSGLSKSELLQFAAIGEQVASEQVHFDNIAPSMLGGMIAVRSITPLEVISIAVPENLYLAMVRPGVVIKTDDAKKLIPGELPLKTVIRQLGQVSGLIAGMQQNDIGLIGRSVDDYLATPYRAKLIPKFDRAREAALNAGASGYNISGSGPAMFAICDGRAVAEQVVASLQSVYADDPQANFYLTKPDTLGTRIIS